MRVGIFLVLVAACAACALPSLGRRDFWPPDEARYALVARELPQGPLLVPRLNGEVYPDKPPGYFASVLGARAVLRQGDVDETSARLPSAVAGTLLVVIVGLWVARAAGPGAGLATGLLLLGTNFFVTQMRVAHLDLAFSAMVAASLACFYATWTSGRRPWCAAAFAFLFLAAFVKGPLALVALPIAALWAVGTRRPRAFFNLGTLAGVLLLTALGATWMYFAWRAQEAVQAGRGDEYLRSLLDQALGRISRAKAHQNPWYFYLTRTPLNLLPFLPFLLLLAFRRVRAALPAAARSLAGFSLLWFVAVLALLNAFEGKRVIYALLAYPPAAMLMGLGAAGAARAMAAPLRAWSGLVAALVVLAAGAAVTFGLSAESWSEALQLLGRWLDVDGLLASAGLDRAAPAVRADLLAWGACVLPAGVAALALVLARAPLAAAGWSALAAGLAAGLAVGWLAPYADPAISRRQLAEFVDKVQKEDGAPGPVGFFRHRDDGVAFYLGRDVPEIAGEDEETGDRPDVADAGEREKARASLREFLARQGALAIVRDKDAELFGFQTGVDYRELGRVAAGQKFLIVVEGAP